MIDELCRTEKFILKAIGQKISNIEKGFECDEYFGFDFQIGQQSIKFRKAKITPKKTGQFVTVWKRNSNGETEPFNASDQFDFLIIATEKEGLFGFFVFTKQALIINQIVTTETKEGKRGFRVYPNWDLPENKSAVQA